MNEIKRKSARSNSLGYNFIEAAYLPKGKDEYYLRNLQNRNGINYRQLTAYEIEMLVRNRQYLRQLEQYPRIRCLHPRTGSEL